MAKATQPTYQFYLYQSHRPERVPYNTPNEKFGKLEYYYQWDHPVGALFDRMILKPNINFTNWGVTKNEYAFVLVKDSRGGVYVIYNNVPPLTENILIEISNQIEYDVNVSQHPMHDERHH